MAESLRPPRLAGEQPRIDPRCLETARPARARFGRVDQVDVACGREPAVARHLLLELPLAPPGITERDDPVPRPGGAGDRAQDVDGARQRPAPSAIARVLPAPILRSTERTEGEKWV